MDEYTFNEELKRFEPTATKCGFCFKNESQNMEDNHFADIYRISDRTNIIVYNSVSYNQISIGIPRCPNCKYIHKKGWLYSRLISWFFFIMITVVSIFIWGFYGIFTIFGFALIPLFIFLTERVIVEMDDVLPKKDGSKKNTFIQDFIIQGWSLKKPDAYS